MCSAEATRAARTASGSAGSIFGQFVLSDQSEYRTQMHDQYQIKLFISSSKHKSEYCNRCRSEEGVRPDKAGSRLHTGWIPNGKTGKGTVKEQAGNRNNGRKQHLLQEGR